jgi:propanol-preferring alcohol dehydrogenase
VRAWVTAGDGRLVADERPFPEPAADEIRVRVEACGVCRTDLHVVDGDLAPHRSPVVPGHEVVGVVDAVGVTVAGWSIGDRAGIAWLRSTCGVCACCRRGDENLCRSARFTGWDADGGYAEYAAVPAAYAYHLSDDADAVAIAPLLCAGIIGYRALRRSRLPSGGALGLWGFGGSAHIAAQVAIHEGARVHVFTRAPEARRLALELGAASAGDSADAPPEPLDAGILFAPAGSLVPIALAALAPGATLAIAGIHLSDVPALEYQRHLFDERTLTSVTANTRDDGRALLALAHVIDVHTRPYPLARAADAIDDLRGDRVTGAAVLTV